MTKYFVLVLPLVLLQLGASDRRTYGGYKVIRVSARRRAQSQEVSDAVEEEEGLEILSERRVGNLTRNIDVLCGPADCNGFSRLG